MGFGDGRTYRLPIDNLGQGRTYRLNRVSRIGSPVTAGALKTPKRIRFRDRLDPGTAEAEGGGRLDAGC